MLSLSLSAQYKIKVRVAGTQNPVYKANIRCNGKLLATTDSKGEAEFTTKCLKVSVFASGYVEAESVVDKYMEVVLEKETGDVRSLEAVVIEDKSDPAALRILDEVNKRYKDNAPNSLDSYEFKSYDKITFDLDQDSIKDYEKFSAARLDSLKAMGNKVKDSAKAKDSISRINMLKMMQSSKMFLWERAQQHLFSKKKGEKILVLDNKISGLQQPIYELLAVRSNRNRLPKEVLPENRNLYRYFLRDSIELDGRQNYIIRFRQTDYRLNPNKRKFNGYIYVDKETYAIKKIESNSNKASEGQIISIWKPLFGKWFLDTEAVKIKVGSMNFSRIEDKVKSPKEKEKDKTIKPLKKYGNYVFITSKYFEFKSPTAAKDDMFNGYTVSIKNSDGSQLDKYRQEPLTEREAETYVKIDSIGEKYKLDNKVNFFQSLLRGKLRWKKIDFDASSFFKYNMYEGLRLGISAKLNEKFHPYISPDAYFAYGFKDRNWKYGMGVDVKTTLEKTSFFRAEVYDDVTSAGRFNENFWSFPMKLLNGGVDLNNDNFLHYRGAKISYTNDLTNALTARISLSSQKENATFDYDFRGLGKSFASTAAMLSLFYSPNSKNIMTPQGKYTFDDAYPAIFVNVEKGLKAIGGTLDYYRVDALISHQFRYFRGVTSVRLYGGISSSDAPLWKNFSMNGLRNPSNKLNFNFTTFLGFATMNAKDYYNDKFVGIYLGQRLPWYFKSFGRNTSSFDLVYKGIIGDMTHPEYHTGINFTPLNKLYSEVGVEWNNFLSTKFNFGFFYRVGPYQTQSFKENFALQLKLSLLKF